MGEEERIPITTAVEFTVKAINIKPVDKVRLKQMVAVIHEFSGKQGLSTKHIKHLAYRVVTRDVYDSTTRRRLLYSFIPEKPDEFPHEILPSILSTVFPEAVENPSRARSWVTSVLLWLLSLLRYNILRTDDIHCRLCYVPCFNMLGLFRFSRLCAQILYELTRRVDVTPLRVRHLNALRRKMGFSVALNKLLRLYCTMRPDLLVLSNECLITNSDSAPNKLMLPALEACTRRLYPDGGDEDEGEELWSNAFKRTKFNPYLRNSVVPAPKVIRYDATLEDKKTDRLNVLQCTRLQQLISSIPSSTQWLWPNNAAALLRRPVLLLWFRTYDPALNIALESWLDLALNTEVLRERAAAVNGVRGQDLLRRVVALAEQQQLTGQVCSPVIHQFLLTHLMLWDQEQHIKLVLRLVRCLGFMSSFWSVVFARLVSPLLVSPLPVTCAVLATLTDTAVNWCLHYNANKDDVVDDEGFSMVEGVLELHRKLEPVMIGATLQHCAHPLLLHHVLDFFAQINASCKELSLPLLVCPSPVLTATLLATADVAVVHRLGVLLSELRLAYARVNGHIERQSTYGTFCEEVLRHTPQYNKTIQLYTSYCYDATSFSGSDAWSDLTKTFLGSAALEEVQQVPDVRFCGALVRGLQCTAVHSDVILSRNNNIPATGDKQEYEQVRDEVLHRLAELGLTGLQESIEANKEADGDSMMQLEQQ